MPAIFFHMPKMTLKYMPLGLDIPYRTQANGKQLRKQHVS